MCRAFIKAVALFVFLVGPAWDAVAGEPATVDALLDAASNYLRSTPEQSAAPLAQLRALRPTFTPAQNERYHLLYASLLGFRGKHEERIAFIQSLLSHVETPAMRSRFLYELVDGNTALGKYENALKAMNEQVLLLPLLSDVREEMIVLNGAVTLLSSLRAYDEALDYADRIYAQGANILGSYAKCVGLTDKVEVNFMRGNSVLARSLVAAAILACDENKNQLFTLIIKTHSAIDLIDSGRYTDGIAYSLPLLEQFSRLSNNSDYVTQLEDAVARAYLKAGNKDRAERYGLQAYRRAQAGMNLQLQEKTSETIAAIKRAQGQLAAAIGYYDINLALKKKVLDDQLHRNIAHQRVKFETQDKANQMALLEQKNKNLGIEKELQHGKYQNLILLLTLGLVLLAGLGAWLVKTLRQKDVFRRSAQVDGLTQVSNRAHFCACAQQAFRDSTGPVSLVLFDMDFFKRINDTRGHATGDWVLKTVCDTAKAQLRKTDMLGRLGGEEFAICLPLATEEEVLALAERCRAAIAAIDTSPSGFSFVMTASFGIATRGINGLSSYEETLVAADKALYLSKNEGRNRVTVYQAPGEAPHPNPLRHSADGGVATTISQMQT